MKALLLWFPFRWTLILWLLAGPLQAADRPNFLWILSEDNSKHFLELFDETGAATPHIEKLAAQGLTFNHAFSCSPVCSVARTTLMTSVYAPRIGIQFHRKIKPVTLPADWKLFPGYLKDAGYYTSNNSKTDYNTSNHQGTWDESSKKATWRKRPTPETPFFHMQTFGTSHESSLHFSRQKMESEPTGTKSESVRLADYHPDTETFRYTYARYHDRIRDIDGQVGQLVEKLRKDGLLEDTFIFYFGDHGGVLPGSKGYARETGLHVPLVVRIPERWSHLTKAKRGSRVDGFVSFVDFGPTLLHLAGLKVPSHMDGKPFLGGDLSLARINARDEAFGYADRFDEKYEMVRTLRKGRFKYVRNFQGYYPDGLQNNYRYKMLAYEEWRDLFRNDKLKAAPKQFFQPKPAEALYDVVTDPYEVHNLAGDPKRRKMLRKLRGRLMERMKSMPDLSLYPESVLVDSAVDDPLSFSRDHKREISRLLKVANLALLPFAKAEPKLKRSLGSDNSWERYWAVTACALLGDEAQPLIKDALPLLQDRELMVRVRAAEFLGGIGASDPRPVLKGVLAQTPSPVVSLLALNAVVYLKDGPRPWKFEVTTDDVPAQDDQVQRRLDYLGGQ